MLTMKDTDYIRKILKLPSGCFRNYIAKQNHLYIFSNQPKISINIIILNNPRSRQGSLPATFPHKVNQNQLIIIIAFAILLN